MACVNPDGTLSTSAVELLKILDVPMTEGQISSKLKRPLFKVRSSLREMEEAGLIKKTGEEYIITDKGREILG